MKAFGVMVVGLVAGLGLAPLAAFGQSPASPFGNRAGSQEVNTQDSYQPPAIFVTGAQLQAEDTHVKGTFDVLNSDQETAGDLHYRLDLLSPAAAFEENQVIQDAGDVYDSVMSTEVFAIIPGEQKRIPFTYNPPRVPKGDYRLRIQLVTSRGRELGWHDANVNVGVEGATFVYIAPGTIGLPEFPDQIIPPSSGPNVASGSTFTLRATLQNTVGEATTVQPVLERYVFDRARGREEKIPLGAALTLAAGESRKVDFPVTAPQKPEVYLAMVSLEDPATATRISNLAEYRWVVRGLDADIVSARIASLHQKQGEIVDVQVDIVGPSDAETTSRGKLVVQLTDTQGAVGSVTEENLELTDALQTGMARVILERDLVGTPGITVTLFDQAGNTLDVYEVPVPLTESQISELLDLSATPATRALPVGVWVGSLVAGVGVLLLIAWFIMTSLTRRRPPSLPGAPLAIIFIVGGLALGGASFAANGITVEMGGASLPQLCQAVGGDWCRLGEGYITELFINSPVHQNTYTNRHAIPTSYRVSFVACQNDWYYSRNVIRYSPEGVTHSSWRPPAGTSWHNIVDILFASDGDEECDHYFCKVSRFYSATLNLSQLPETAGATTLQIMSTRARLLLGVPPPWNENRYTEFSTWPLFTHAVNLWLKFPTPAPVPTPPPSGACSTRYATHLVAHTPVDNGGPGSHNNPGVGPSATSVLGPPNNDAEDFDNVGSQAGFVTVGFAPGVVGTDGPGDDVEVWFKDFSTVAESGGPETEPVTVLGSADGINFVTLLPERREATQSRIRLPDVFGYDIAGRLPFVKFIKIVNLAIVTNHALEGPEIDAVGIAVDNCTMTTPTPTPTLPPGGSPTPTPSEGPGVAVCSDGLDNDNDERVDSADPTCHTDHNPANPASYRPLHTTEREAACSDLGDNDGDNRIDAADPGCHTDRNATNSTTYNPGDDSEADTQCSDGLNNNDGDSVSDAADPGCHTDGNANNPASYDPGDDNEQNTVVPGGLQEID